MKSFSGGNVDQSLIDAAAALRRRRSEAPFRTAKANLVPHTFMVSRSQFQLLAAEGLLVQPQATHRSTDGLVAEQVTLAFLAKFNAKHHLNESDHYDVEIDDELFGYLEVKSHLSSFYAASDFSPAERDKCSWLVEWVKDGVDYRVTFTYIP